MSDYLTLPGQAYKHYADVHFADGYRIEKVVLANDYDILRAKAILLQETLDKTREKVKACEQKVREAWTEYIKELNNEDRI